MITGVLGNATALIENQLDFGYFLPIRNQLRIRAMKLAIRLLYASLSDDITFGEGRAFNKEEHPG